jgi:UBX domain-containing protein 11
MIRNINELNSLTDCNEPKIIDFTKNGAKFETIDNKIKLRLYANGIALYNGPFRDFSDSLTRKFCIDIMDGYFPSELQTKYPDGVPFDVIDKRDTLFQPNELNSVYKSKGYRLGDPTEDQTTIKPTITTDSKDKKNVETQLTGILIKNNKID